MSSSIDKPLFFFIYFLFVYLKFHARICANAIKMKWTTYICMCLSNCLLIEIWHKSTNDSIYILIYYSIHCWMWINNSIWFNQRRIEEREQTSMYGDNKFKRRAEKSLWKIPIHIYIPTLKNKQNKKRQTNAKITHFKFCECSTASRFFLSLTLLYI